MTRTSIRLEGIMIPMITPFDRNEDIDEAALKRYVDWLIRQGVHSLYPCSGCGEAWKLTTEEKKRIIEIVVKAADGRVPVLAGTAEASTRATIELTRFSQKVGADAAVIWPKLAYGAAGRYSDETIVDHYRAIHDATGFPIILYDCPEICGYVMSPDLIARLAEIETVIGLKDSTGQMDKFQLKLSLVGDRIRIVQGWDILLLPSLLLGAAGGCSSRANIVPRFMVELYNKLHSGAIAEAQAMNEKLQALTFSKRLRHDLWQTMKIGVSLQGIPVGDVRRPRFSPPFNDEAIAEIRQRLSDFGVRA